MKDVECTHQSTGAGPRRLFARRLGIRVEPGARPLPLAWLDSFAMRSFTGDAAFDDTLPIGDGLLEAGHRVPVDRLGSELEHWCRRKGWLVDGERLSLEEYA